MYKEVDLNYKEALNGKLIRFYKIHTDYTNIKRILNLRFLNNYSKLQKKHHHPSNKGG